MDIKTIKRIAIPVLENADVVKAGIFGSYATGHVKKDSDIDLLVEFKNRKSLFDLVGIKLELEELLKHKVDLLTYRSLNHLIRERILNEQIILYEKRT